MLTYIKICYHTVDLEQTHHADRRGKLTPSEAHLNPP